MRPNRRKRMDRGGRALQLLVVPRLQAGGRPAAVQQGPQQDEREAAPCRSATGPAGHARWRGMCDDVHEHVSCAQACFRLLLC